MATGRDQAGLEDLGAGLYAYLQPDGSWGLSNAGLVSDGGQSLLIDTLYDLKRTRRMLDSMAKATPAARQIGTVVNTHANGDHCYGNQLVRDSRIISSTATAEEMNQVPPELMAKMRAKSARMGSFNRSDFPDKLPAKTAE